MIYFTDEEIDKILSEDVPFYDLTTTILKLENKPAKIQFFTTEETVVCCTEEVMRMFKKLSIRPTLFTPSGETLEKGVKFLEGEGLSKNIHLLWRSAENLISYSSGIATAVRHLLDIVRSVNPEVIVTTTRKIFPYTRKIVAKAVQSGGSCIHRLGLSETIYIFENHYCFLGNVENLKKRLKEQYALIGDKTITIEVKTPEQALQIAETNVNIIQCSSFTPDQIRWLKTKLNELNKNIKIAAAEGITDQNIKDYVMAGADIIITSWPYLSAPKKIKVLISPLDYDGSWLI